jgi:hypothetical protein
MFYSASDNPVMYYLASLTAWSKQYSTVVVSSSMDLNQLAMQCSGVTPQWILV